MFDTTSVSEPDGPVTLPQCVTKSRKRFKNFMLNDHGFIILTPPRRTVPREKQVFLPPRPELLFGTNEFALRYPAAHPYKKSQESAVLLDDLKRLQHLSIDPIRGPSDDHGQPHCPYPGACEQSYGIALSKFEHLQIEAKPTIHIGDSTGSYCFSSETIARRSLMKPSLDIMSSCGSSDQARPHLISDFATIGNP